MMNIAIIGTGGTGGYFGGKLTQILTKHPELKIFFIARGSHLQQIREHGLTLDTDEGEFLCTPTLATDSFDDLPQLDLVLVCVKGFDLEEALNKLKLHVHEKTMLLPLLNGVDIYERIRKVITTGVVFPACVYVGTHIERPGKVTQRGGTCMIHFGKDPAKGFIDQQIFGLLTEAGIKYTFYDDPYPEIWKKYIFIAAFGLVTAASGETIGAVMKSEELGTQVKRIMNEIRLIAEKRGIALSPSIVEESYQKGGNFPFETKTSFQRDYERADKPDERDLFAATIIRLGGEYGIATPATKEVYTHLRPKNFLSSAGFSVTGGKQPQ